MPTDYSIAFWNLENLFDIENSPRRTDKLQRAIGSDIAGWDQTKLDRKIAQLASIIAQLGDGNGPDMLGVCEVENRHVLTLLVHALAPLGRNYTIEHADTADKRGIDVAFIYDGDLFTRLISFNHFVMRRTATRDILQVNFETQKKRLFVVVANHWPARTSDMQKSAGYRAIAGETLAYFHQRILQVHGKNTPVLSMGDFNDEPFDPSLVTYALSTRSRTRVAGATSPRLWNLMWPHVGKGIASHYYNNLPNNLDQFLVNKNMIKKTSLINVLPETVQIHQFPEMFDAKKKYPVPIRFGGMGKKLNLNGFSDNYPISLKVREND